MVSHVTSIIVTCGNWDIETILPEQCQISGLSVPKIMKRWLNIKDLSRKLNHKKLSSFKKLMEHYGLEIEGRHHSGIDDSHNIRRILKEMLSSGLEITEDDIYYLH